jgi:hypothetical protein
MKLIITESQLEKSVFKYLDMKDPYVLKTSHSYMFFTSRQTIEEGENPIMNYSMRDKDCFISSDFAEDVVNMFSLFPDNALSIISDWVENKLGVDVVRYYSDFGAD